MPAYTAMMAPLPPSSPSDRPELPRVRLEVRSGSGRSVSYEVGAEEFLIGGASGPPETWRQKDGLLLSLSAPTMPHELARVVLAEQIYRAFTLLRGHPYPK